MFFVRRIKTDTVECFDTARKAERYLLGKQFSDFEIYFVASPIQFKEGDNFRTERALTEATQNDVQPL